MQFRLQAATSVVMVLGWVGAFSASARADGPPPGSVVLTSAQYSGSGCPAGSSVVSLSPDASAFTILFDSFVAAVGPGVPTDSQMRDCTYLMQLQIPDGWNFSVQEVDYRGYAQMDEGITAVERSHYHFFGIGHGHVRTDFAGPMDDDYLVRGMVEDRAWSPCKDVRRMSLQTVLKIKPHRQGRRDGTALLTVDSIDGRVEHVYHLDWQPCSPRP